LTARKLILALFNLYVNDGMPDLFQIVGCGRTKMSESQFKDRIKNALDAVSIPNHVKWPGFADALTCRLLSSRNASILQIREVGDLSNLKNI